MLFYKNLFFFFLVIAFCSCQKEKSLSTTTVCVLIPGTGQFLDTRDGTTYQTVELCGTTWMAENLRYETLESHIDSNCTAPFYGGRFYSHQVAKTACPNGWHLATDEEWTRLELLLGIDSAQINSFTVGRGTEEDLLKLKANSPLWTAGGNNLSGMNVYPTGYQSKSSSWYNYGAVIFLANYTAFFWTASEYVDPQYNNRYIARLISQSHGSYKSHFATNTGLPCRCVQD